jgi:hypothetical protein
VRQVIVTTTSEFAQHVEWIVAVRDDAQLRQMFVKVKLCCLERVRVDFVCEIFLEQLLGNFDSVRNNYS